MSRSYRLALLGQNIAYSKSPDIFAAIAQTTGAEISFELRSISPERLADEVNHMSHGRYDGFFCTIPFKEQIIPFLGSCDRIAQETGSVNCVTIGRAGMHGHNTDFYGFLLGLERIRGSLRPGDALIFGTGGAARTAALAISSLPEIGTIRMAGRHEEVPASLARLWPHVKNPDYIPLRQLRGAAGNDFALVVNATPLGGWNAPDLKPAPDDFVFSSGCLYYDLNYNANNPMIQKASTEGAVVIDGRVMLVGQALRAFQIWSELEVSFDPVFHQVFGDQ